MPVPLLRFVKDPLFLFLVLGALLFGATSLWQDRAPVDDSRQQIAVTKEDVLTFLQYKLGAFDPDKARTQFEDMSPDARQALIDDYVRNEVLVREARGIGLTEDDAVIRQRLIQRMEFALESVVAPSGEPDDASLQSYLEAHADYFTQDPAVSFTHIFYRDGKVPPEDAARLNSRDLTPGEALEMGDPFSYFDTYSERPARIIVSHFGEDFTAQIFDPQTPLQEWIGPLPSPHGIHFVYLTARAPALLPPLSEVRASVRESYLRDTQDRAINEAISALIGSYEVSLSPDLSEDLIP